jgi:hypothetical protein
MSEELDFASTTTHIKLDLFPATISLGASDDPNSTVLYREARLIVTNDYIYGIMMGSIGPYLAIREELVDFEMIPKVGYQVTGAHNDYFVVRDGNCGCGSRLRSMIFLRGVGHILREATIKQR